MLLQNTLMPCTKQYQRNILVMLQRYIDLFFVAVRYISLVLHQLAAVKTQSLLAATSHSFHIFDKSMDAMNGLIG